MKVIQKSASGNQVELDITAEPEEVNKCLDLAGQYFLMNMGVRPDRNETVQQTAERALSIKDLDSVVENDAVQLLIPYALEKRNIVPAYAPEPLPSMQIKRGKPYSFRTYVLPKPTYELTSYDAPAVTVPRFKPEIGDAVDKQLEQMAEQSATYEDCDDQGPVANDSAIKLGLKILLNGKEDERLSTDGRTYLMGKQFMPEEFERELIGMKPGETKHFTCDLPDWDPEANKAITVPADCTVTIVSMQKKVIPAITDEWVKMNVPMAFSVAMLRESMEAELSMAQRRDYDAQVKQYILDSISSRFNGRIDDAIYEATSKDFVRNLRDSVAHQNMKWEEFVEQNGGEQQVQMMLMMQVRASLVSGYILDAIYRHEHLKYTNADMREACSQFSPQNPDGVRKEFEDTGRGFVLRELAERTCALNWLAKQAKITYLDENGNAAAPDDAKAAAAIPAADKQADAGEAQPAAAAPAATETAAKASEVKPVAEAPAETAVDAAAPAEDAAAVSPAEVASAPAEDAAAVSPAAE